MVNRCQLQDNTDILTIIDFKAAIMTMLHEIKENTFKIKKKAIIIRVKKKNLKKEPNEILELKNTISEIKTHWMVLVI